MHYLASRQQQRDYTTFVKFVTDTVILREEHYQL